MKEYEVYASNAILVDCPNEDDHYDEPCYLCSCMMCEHHNGVSSSVKRYQDIVVKCSYKK